MGRSTNLNLHRTTAEHQNQYFSTSLANIPNDILIEIEQPHPVEVQSKIEKDINFLEHRLKLLRAQKHQNTASLETYEDMLENRYTILKQLNETALNG